MINLTAIYGNTIFNRKKSYRVTRYIPLIASLIINTAIAVAIIRIFDVNWDYAFLKVCVLLFLFGITSYSLSFLIDLINYRLTIKDVLSSEIRHYLRVFNTNVNWSEISTYDDFLLEAAFNKALPDNLRVLAAINYGNVADAMSIDPHFENRCYKLFSEIVTDFIPDQDR